MIIRFTKKTKIQPNKNIQINSKIKKISFILKKHKI